MNGKDGKPFKTRDGGVMRLEYLVSEIDNEMLKKITVNQKAKENLGISEEYLYEMKFLSLIYHINNLVRIIIFLTPYDRCKIGRIIEGCTV